MRVTAMLAWYNEDPAILYRAVASARHIADEVIAVDGRWDHYPGDDVVSPQVQYDAIRKAASDSGLRLYLHGPEETQTWTGQVAKRQAMLDLATEADWLMPLDADWELQADRDQIRAVLRDTGADSITVPFHTPINPAAKLRDVASTAWHERLAGTTVYEPLIWRHLEDMRVERYHWCYSGLKDGQRIWLWGNDDKYPQADTEATDHLTILHHCLHRDQRTVLANRIYCDERDRYAAKHGREP